MAINPNIALQGQPVNMLQAIQGGLQTGEMIRQSGMRDAIMRQQVQAGQQGLQQGQQQLQQGEMQLGQGRAAMAQQKAQTLNTVARQLASVPLAERANVLARMMPTLTGMGMKPEQIMDQDLSDQGLMEVINQTQAFVPQGGEAFTLKPGETRFDPQGRPIASGGEVPDANQEEVRKEVRKELRSTVGDLRKTAGNLRSNYEKLTNLGEEMRKGNRTAVSQGLVALVKLGDPTSVVREAEMEAALNKENPVAAITNLLQSKGTADGVISAVASKIDPLSPENVNVDDILATANAMMVPNIQEVRRGFEISQGRARENLGEAGIKSIFGERTEKLFSDLGAIESQITQSRAQVEQSQEQAHQGAQQPTQQNMGDVVMEHPTFGAVTEADIQRTMQDTGMSRQQVFERLMEQAQ